MDEIEDYRLKAKRKYESGKLLLDSGYYSDSVTHFYYAMLLTAKALLIKEKIQTKKHKGIINKFYEIYVDKKGFNKEIYQNFARTQTLRQEADYEARDTINENIAILKRKHCEEFLKESDKFY